MANPHVTPMPSLLMQRSPRTDAPRHAVAPLAQSPAPWKGTSPCEDGRHSLTKRVGPIRRHRAATGGRCQIRLAHDE